MKQLLRWMLVFLLIVVTLIGGAFYYLTYHFDINAFKDDISQVVFEHTGRKLTIDGDIRWALFPTLRIEINDIVLGNAPEFEGSFLSANKLALQVDTGALLHKQLKIKGAQLMTPSLHLQQKANGINNWSFSKAASPTQENNVKITTNTRSALAPIGLLATLTLDELLLQDATIQFNDHKTHQTYLLKNFKLQIHQMQPEKPFPIQLSGTFSTTNPAITGSVELSAKLHIALQEMRVSLSDGVLRQKIQPSQADVLSSTLHFAIDYLLSTDTLTITELKGDLLNLGAVNISGKITSLTTTPKITLSILGNAWTLPQGIKIDQFKTTLQYQSPTAILPDLTAQLYQGVYQGKIRLDHNQSLLNISAQGACKDISIANLLKDLSGTIPLAGTFSFQHDLNTIGKTNADLVTNLTGPMSFRLDNGVLSGIDLSYIFSVAKAKLDNTSTTRTDSGQTAIGYMTGKMMAGNGIIKNTVLSFEGDNYHTTGTGTIRLQDFYVDYDLTSAITKAQAKENAWLNTPIPIKVTGIPPNLSVTPNFSVLFDQLLKQQINKQSQKLLDRLTEKYGKDLGEGVNDAIERGLGEDVKNLPFGNLLKKQ